MHRFAVRAARALTFASAAVAMAARAPSQEPQQTRTERIEAFATEFARRVEAGDVAYLSKAFDTDAMLERCFAGVETTATVRRCANAFRLGFKRSNTMFRGLAQAANGGSYLFLRLVEVDGETRALFRLVAAEGALNFHEFTVDVQGDEIRFVDLYAYLSGELVSETMRRMFALANLDHEPGLLSRLLGGGGNDLVQRADDVKRMSELFWARRYDKVLDVYASLPKSLRHEKMFLVLRIQAAAAIGDDAKYLRALEDFEKFVPADDPGRNLTLLDAYLMRGQYDELVETVERLRKRVGDDGWLRSLQAVAMMEKGDHARAREFGALAVAEEPELIEGHANRIAASMLEENHAETLRAIEECEEYFELNEDWLPSFEGYEAFEKSAYGRKWMSGR